MANFIPVTRSLAATLIPELEYFLRDLSHAFFHRYALYVGKMFIHLFHMNHEQSADNIGVGWKLDS